MKNTITKFKNNCMKYLFILAVSLWGLTENVLSQVCYPDFYYNNTSGTVTFYDSSAVSSSMPRYWYFGDGGAAVGTNVTHTYNSSGTYTVCLAIYTDTTFSDTCGSICKTITVLLTGTCSASFYSYQDTSNYSMFYFSDNSSSTDGTITSWSWDFGDSTTSNLQNPTHTFADTGYYDVCLSITTDSGCIADYCQNVHAGDVCSAYFGSTANANIISFYYNNSDSTNMNYLWDFGDSTTSTLRNPVHTYPAGTGQYYVCLTITNTLSGCTNSYCQWIYYNSACSAYFYSYEDSSGGTFDNVISFYNYSDNTDTYSWDFGDGTSSSDENPTHIYANAGIYTVCLIASSTSTSCSDTFCQTVYVGDLSGLYGYVSGTVYLDVNGNCVQDSSETGIPNMLVYLAGSPSWDYTYTDANGNYTFGALPGTYGITAYPSYYFNLTQVCPTGSFSVTVATGQTSSGNNFYMKPKGSGQDLSIYMSCWGFTPGFTAYSWIDYCNDGGTIMNGSVEFTHDVNITLSTTDTGYGAPDSYNSGTQTATWNFTNLMPGECRIIYVAMDVPTTLALGTIVNNSAIVLPTSGDATIANNSAACVDSVSGSYDPNEKHAIPQGSGTEGYIDPATTTLTYRIDFQNTGTAPAYTVVVRDTVDVNVVDVQTISPMGAKHAFTADIKNGNELTFTFNNIMLPDSNTNEPASHGFVMYTVNLKPGMPIGTQIKNSASIYFDFNAPVKTNTTLNTLGFALGIKEVAVNSGQMNILPNPFAENTNITYSLQKNTIVSLEVFNVLGEKVKTILNSQNQNAGSYNFNLNGKDLNENFYLVKLSIDGKVTTKKVLMVR